MAKLNGVTLVSERISYNSVEYMKSEEAAVAGDIVRCDESGLDRTEGAFYEVVRVDSFGDPRIIDDASDEVDADTYVITVFKRVEVAAKVDTDDTVVHEGVKYRKVSRLAHVGDLVKVIANTNSHLLRIGEVVKITRGPYSSFSNSMATGKSSTWMKPADYVVLEPITASVTPTPTQPTALPDAYVIHDGKVYVKEARKANAGESLIITNAYSYGGKYKNGDILTYRSDFSFDMVYVEGVDYAVYTNEYNVLVPTDSITIDGVEYALEKRKAAKGDMVLYVTLVGRKSYDIGAIMTAERVSTDCGHINKIIGGDYGMFPSEYLVLAPKAAGKPQYREEEKPTYTEVKRKANVGERIRIVNAWVTMGQYKNGDEFTVKHVIDAGGVTVNEVEAAIVTREYVVLEPSAVVKQAANPVDSRLKVGEYAKVVGDGKKRGVFSPHGFTIGEIIKVTKWSDIYEDRVAAEYLDGRDYWYVHNDDYVRATDAEVAQAKCQTEQARKEADQKAQQDALEAKWSAIGRKVNEFKVGDIVRFNQFTGADEFGKGTVIALDQVTGSSIRFGKNGMFSGGTSWIDLIAPVESLFTR